jgi:hypothetical protein
MVEPRGHRADGRTWNFQTRSEMTERVNRPASLFFSLVLLAGSSLRAGSAPSHPFLLTTSADVERARQGVKQNEAFAQLAQKLVARARSERIEDLPVLERDWWEAARQKSWRETYPEIFHHTFIAPHKWADLAHACARASLLEPSAELPAKAKRLLLALSSYTFEFEHYDVGMNYTIWAIAALDAYDILHDQFDASERSKLDAFFERLLAAVSKNDEFWVEHEPGGKLNNHYAWHKLCFCALGAFYDRPALIEPALNGPKGVHFMLQHGFKDGGLWLEGSIPYHFAATSPLLLIAEILENAHYPVSLYQHETADGRNLKQSYDALLPLLFPDRTLPPIGDCYGRRPHLGEHPDWEVLYRRFQEPAYAWLLADRNVRSPQALFSGVAQLPAAKPPHQASALWPEMGYVALRSDKGTNYWSGRGWTVFATYSHRPVHEHADKLSLMLFADGHLWLPDCEAKTSAEHAFSSQVQSQLNRETLCHNTLLVDGRSQRLPGQRLDLLEFSSLPHVKRATFGDLGAQLYPGVRQLRTIIVRPDYVLDFFQVQSPQSHEYAWLTHVDGKPVNGSLKELKPVELPASTPWPYLQNPKTSACSNSFWECFAHNDGLLRLDVLASAPGEVVQCGFPRDDSRTPSTVPMRMVRAKQSDAWFLALYRLVSKPDAPCALKVRSGEMQTWNVSVESEGKVLTHTIPSLSAMQ